MHDRGAWPGQTGQMVDRNPEIIAAGIVIGHRDPIARAEQRGEIVEPQRHKLHRRTAQAPSVRFLLGRIDLEMWG